MKSNMIKRGIILKKVKGYFIVDDVDVINGFATIRKFMNDGKGNIYYGKRIYIGLKQLDDYMIV